MWKVWRELTARLALGWLKPDASGGMVSARQSFWRGQYVPPPFPNVLSCTCTRQDMDGLMALPLLTRTKHRGSEGLAQPILGDRAGDTPPAVEGMLE